MLGRMRLQCTEGLSVLLKDVIYFVRWKGVEKQRACVRISDPQDLITDPCICVIQFSLTKSPITFIFQSFLLL